MRACSTSSRTAGTLFLDEIGERPLEAQAKLLRVLQRGEFERVGGLWTLHADVRIVVGAHCGTICDASYPTFMLTHWARDRRGERLPLPWIVKSLCRTPALALGLEDRGPQACAIV